MATNDSTPKTIEIQLTKGYVAIVDEQDADLALLKWCVLTDKRGHNYARRTHYNADKSHVTLILHRVIMGRKLGRDLDDSEIVDHKDGNGLNNTRSNLRIASIFDNARNSRKPVNSTRNFKGVDRKGNARWVVSICVAKNVKHMGTFKDEITAAAVYNHYASEYFGEFARLNDVDKWEEIARKALDSYSGLYSSNKSGYVGVAQQSNGLWRAYCYANKKQIHIGLYATAELANEARVNFLKGDL